MDLIHNLILTQENNGTLKAMMKVIANKLNSQFISVAWQIVDNYWVIPAIARYSNGQFVYTQIDKVVLEQPNEQAFPVENIKIHTFSNNSLIAFQFKGKLNKLTKYIIQSYLAHIINNDKLYRINHKRQLLLSNICHSIRTPLNGILHMTNLLRQSSNINPKLEGPLSDLYQSSIQLADNIFDVVDLTKLDMKSIQINKSCFNMYELLSDVLSLANIISRDQIIIHQYIDTNIPEYCYSDMRRIKQIMINLIKNAINHVGKGEISLFVKAKKVDVKKLNNPVAKENVKPHTLIFYIEDQSKKPIDARLLQPMEISHNVEQYNTDLRLAYLLSKKIGGDLHLEYHGGNRVIFELISYHEEPPEVHSETLKKLKGKRVLLIDDKSTKMNMLTMLDAFGLVYSVARSFDELSNKEYDIIICRTPLWHNQKDMSSKIKKMWPNSLRLAITYEPNELKPDIFHDYIHSPTTKNILKNKLISMVNTKQETMNFSTKRILIVEDEPINQMVLEQLLRNKGYKNIELANDGEEAIEMIKFKKPKTMYCVGLLDIRMPHMSGFELAKKIRDMLGNSIKLIGITAQMILDHEPTHLFNHMTIKPVDIHKLDELIKE